MAVGETMRIIGGIWGPFRAIWGHLTAFNGTESDDEDNEEDLGAIWEYFGASPGRLETP